VTEVFDAAGAGILLADAGDELGVVASTSEQNAFIELLQLDAGDGPCIEAFTTGTVVSVADPHEMQQRWPKFAEAAAGFGYESVHAIPLRLRDASLGSLNLFRATPGTLNRGDAVAAQALADVATISILQQRILEQSELAQSQLQRALDSRVVIEQAKGFVAHTHQVDMDAAFALLRDHARSNGLRLVDVAARVIARDLVI
jgi:GAF domain-containing protein